MLLISYRIKGSICDYSSQKKTVILFMEKRKDIFGTRDIVESLKCLFGLISNLCSNLKGTFGFISGFKFI